MYRHLLVPVDGTDLSTLLVGQAAEFARELNARITFFHAVADPFSSLNGDAAVVMTTSPNEYVYAFEGRARELLSKAESAARALGVPCSALSAVSDKPYEAILEAARNAGCDLIYMASHGRRSNIGMMLGSQTLKVIMQTEIPVLIVATRNPATPARTLGIIRDEHRSLAAVVHAWTHLLASARAENRQPDRAIMGAMVRYIREFPLTLHHPKEDDYLFRLLRERTSSVDAEIEELHRQHERDHEMVAELAALVESEGSDLAALEDAVARYARFLWDHLGREEGVILPAAQKYLTAEDWAQIDAAFSANNDPRFGSDTDLQYRRLFSRIVNLAAPTETAAAAE
jgi:nucleotide-binding universal stress UspA family protein/hemerythrin-like domain-containing protein